MVAYCPLIDVSFVSFHKSVLLSMQILTGPGFPDDWQTIPHFLLFLQGRI